MEPGDVVKIKWEHRGDEYVGELVSEERGFLILSELGTGNRLVCRPSALVMLKVVSGSKPINK